jgi:ornithine cyclodeaminase/alanine dehydrogenase-like protein (mu-crystallin family)
MIFLNRAAIENIVSLEEVMGSVENAFLAYENNNFVMPDRIHVNNKENTLLYMPCFTDEIFGTKSLTLFPKNSQIGKPVIDGFMTLNDPNTGEPLAMIDGKTLTELRTGAVGGVGAKHLSERDSSTLGLIGAGVQGFQQILFISKVRPIKKVKIYGLNIEKLKKFSNRLKKKIDIEVVICRSVEEVLDGTDIVITATSSENPVLPNKAQLLKGKTFIGIGSYKPTMREFPKEIYSLLDKIYTDTYFAKEESGDLSYPLSEGLIKEEQIHTIGSFLGSKEKKIDETVFFKSVGMALLDLYVAKTIYEKAVQLNIGQKINI